MRRMNSLSLLLLILLSALVMSGCDRVNPPLTIATSKWPGYSFITLAEREGWLAEKNIQIIEKNSATEMLQALADGSAIGATLTLDEVLRARDSGIPLQVVMVFNESMGGDVVLSKQKLVDLAELKGVRIGVEKSAVGALMLYKTLERANLTEADVELVDSPIDQQFDDWNDDKFDVVITYEPVAGRLEREGAHRLMDSRDLPDLIFDVLAVRSDLAPQHAAALRHLTASHFRALQRMHINPQDSAYRIASYLGITGEEVLSAFRVMELPNLTINRGYLADEGKVVSAARDISAIMLKSHLLTQEVGLTGLVSSNYLPVEK